METCLHCANCGAENDASHKFCFECGAALSAVCPSCGHENDPGHKFCSECGHDLSGSAHEHEPAITPASEPGERRFVSVLFADLVGFTTFSESRDPEEVRAMLTRYFDRAREVIERFGGEVDKFIGDAVTAFWGAKQAEEDDAERAVRAALELVDAVEALGEELDIPELTVRAGVLSGETSVGVGGNEKGLVVGDIVNTASRLQSAADPGTVFVGDSTKQLTEAGIRYRSVGEQEMKGKSVPVTAWRAVDVLGQRGGKGRWGGLEAPFVGRDDELRLLKDQLHATTRDGHARIVSIVGEAGIGKSRLGWELLKYVDGLDEVFRWHQGRSPAYGDGVTFWALGEMVRRRAGIAEVDDPHKARTKLRTSVAEYVPDPEEQRWIEPRLAGLLGLDDMPAGEKSELYAALRTFFQRVSETGTAVLLFEDLHWADSALLDFVEELVERSPRHPILVVTLARPDLHERHPQWGSRRNGVAIHLGPLTDAQMGELVAGLAPGIPDAATDLVVTQAAGIPLYAVEYVRMLLAGGQLVEDAGTFELTESLDSLAVPDSLHSVIAARLDRFSDEDRDLIQNASVLGQSFFVDGLAALTGLSEADLERRLSELARQEVFRYEDDPLSPERGQYQFVQSVIKEVAYGRLAKQERRERHLRVAEYFEAQDDPEMAPIIASHYASALEAEPDDELAERVLRSLTSAAERAADLRAHEQVLALSNQAIALADHAHQRAPIELIAARAAHGMDREDEAIAYAGSALAAFEASGDEEGALVAATDLGTILLNYHHVGKARELLEPLYAAGGGDALDGALAAQYARAEMMHMSMNAEPAVDAANTALAAAEAAGDNRIFTDALITKGSALQSVGRIREGTILLEGALDIADEADLTAQRGRAINNLAVFATTDDERAVLELMRRGLDAALRTGHGYETHFMAIRRAWFTALDGDYAESLALIDEHNLEVDRTIGYGSPGLYIEWAQGDAADLSELQASVDAIDASKDPQLAGTVGDASALYALIERRFDDAFSLAIEVEFLPWVDAPLIALYAALLVGDPERFERAAVRAAEWPWAGSKARRIALLTEAGRAVFAGETGDAISHFTELIELTERVALTVNLNRVRALFAAVVGSDVPEASKAGKEAHQWIVDTGSYGYLEAWKDGLPEQAAEAAG